MKDVPVVPPLLPRGSFTGVPSHFRGWCDTASQGGKSGGYQWVGRQFGGKLIGYVPHDLRDYEWLTLVHQMEMTSSAETRIGKGSLSGCAATSP